MKVFQVPMLAMSLVGLGLLSGLDTPPARADFTFGEPVNLQSTFPLLDLMYDFIDCISADGLEMYFDSVRGGGQGQDDLWVCKRASVEDDWGPPENLGPAVNSASMEQVASLSGDGLELYFVSLRPGGPGNGDLYVVKRATRNSPWGPASNLGPPVNSPYLDHAPRVSSDGLELYFGSTRPGGYGDADLYVSTRATPDDPWGDPVHLGPAVNSPAVDLLACPSPDGLLLFFPSFRPGGNGDGDIWVARRASRSAPWEPPVNLGPIVNGPTYDGVPFLPADGSALYFMRASGSTWTQWKAPILPIVDFNGDGKVDGKEVLALAQHWGQSQRLFDIGLSPMGDGIVDINDVIALAGYIGQDVNDPTLIAHWALDETEGMTAADSVGHNDLTVLGNAAWQPAGGKIGGALEFDGKDDFAISSSTVLDPATGPFSVIAWIKGGAKNRVIVSQTAGADWLYLNKDGMLAADLKASGKDGKTLTSSASLLDDQWHRVVFTWDGTNRVLGVDGVEVARDTQPNLAASSGKLNIGAGRTLAATSRWSGLIDDVRIYNRAVQP